MRNAPRTSAMAKEYVTVCRRSMSSDPPPDPCPECGHGGYMHEPFTNAEVCVICQIDLLNARLENLIAKLT